MADTPEQRAALWRNRFISLLDRSPVPIAISHTDGVIAGANPAFAAVWGLHPGQLTSRQLMDLFTPTSSGQLRKLDEALRHGRRSRYPVRVRWTAGGTSHDGQLVVEPVSDPEGESPPLLVTLHPDAEPEAVPARPYGAGAAVAVSEQESRILALVAAGNTTAAVARVVGLSADGVNYHLKRLCTLLDASNRTALVARAYVLGLLDPGTWPPAPPPGAG
ncbi:PAS domain-containing protein [Streptomyces sp. RPT161]|uniref:PAS domain-containing protein n=1 Tax=Streptomyces sp. RPT161 TaxID=3015993 RepID=UPI0022B88CED|nr:PAS domain-containing protein [Streptomyces sp. RPT161]